jgi:hypothetical protein
MTAGTRWLKRNPLIGYRGRASAAGRLLKCMIYLWNLTGRSPSGLRSPLCSESACFDLFLILTVAYYLK